ncbi:unnamed protein product [Ectocarpus fasciculatus]
MGVPSSDKQSVFEDLVEANVVDVPIFSFFMGNIDTGSPTGFLTLGGVNQTHYEGCLEWVAVAESASPDGFWSIVLQNIYVGSSSVLRSPVAAIFDTGTSMIVGPFSDVAYLAEEIGATCVYFTGIDSSSVETMDCMSSPSEVELILMECDSEFGDINISFGGDDFTLTSNELLQPLTDFVPSTVSSSSTEPWCLFGMLGHDENMWILGDSFLRTFYTAYNVEDKTVGLARATALRTGDECEADAPVSATPVDGGDGDGGDDDDAASDAGEAAEATTSPTTPESSPAASSAQATPAPLLPLPSPSSDGSGGDASAAGYATPAPEGGADGSSGSGEAGASQGGEGSQSDGGAAVESDEAPGGTGGDSGEPSLAAVAAAASIGTLVAVALCGVTGLLVVRRIRRGEHRHTKLELGRAGGGGKVVTGAEDDFLQAGPGGYRDNGSGSHRYRVAAAETSGGGGGGGRLTVVSGMGGEEEEEGEPDDEVEVDFGVSRATAGSGTPSGGGGPLGRMFGRRGEGFVALGDDHRQGDELGGGRGPSDSQPFGV